MQREWTGSCANLAESMEALAVKFASRANETGDSFLQDEAYTLSEWADAIRELYARLDVGDGLVTNAQGVAIARLMRGRLDETATVSRPLARTAGLPENWLLVTFSAGFECGIAPDGSVSS
jgi:hypothetical protein